ncbi:hypothetical protein F3Y22_tig00112383pilonHSYRG00259 [Hibiscus syriacus]|uniref:Uncharacterized protein n=1 Tax=Hibiscus syriacus TaxID=106335 RepID=A0A6A2XYP5_HIBSY|nr:hypothetical protein F3Y22_tig00112383pilonHSYRG00259 [Hibiscus syriacus]
MPFLPILRDDPVSKVGVCKSGYPELPGRRFLGPCLDPDVTGTREDWWKFELLINGEDNKERRIMKGDQNGLMHDKKGNDGDSEKTGNGWPARKLDCSMSDSVFYMDKSVMECALPELVNSREKVIVTPPLVSADESNTCGRQTILSAAASGSVAEELESGKRKLPGLVLLRPLASEKSTNGLVDEVCDDNKLAAQSIAFGSYSLSTNVWQR